VRAAITLIGATLLLAALPAAAATLELKDFKATDEAKKVTMTFTLSAAADAQVISNYQGNFVAISVPKLRFPRALLKGDHAPESKETEQFYRYVRFQQTETEGQIRIYLGKLATPADLQVVQIEDKITAELVKPLWKLPGATEAAEGEPPAAQPAAQQPPAEQQPAAEEQPPSVEAGESAGEQAPAGGFRAGGEEPAGAGSPEEGAAPAGFIPDEQPAGDESQPAAGPPEPEQPATPPANGEGYGQTTFDEVFGQVTSEGEEKPAGTEEQPAAGSTPPAAPAGEAGAQPSYKQFDLSRVPVSQVEIKGLPFDQALLQLVSSTGFNVVIGEGVETGEVNLSFTHKDVSLKSALDLLCLAYDLTYVVEDDAIVIRGKQ